MGSTIGRQQDEVIVLSDGTIISTEIIVGEFREGEEGFVVDLTIRTKLRVAASVSYGDDATVVIKAPTGRWPSLEFTATCCAGDLITLGHNIIIYVVRVRAKKVRIDTTAPRCVRIDKEETFNDKLRRPKAT